MTASYRKYKELIDPLVSYSCDKFQEITLQKLGYITLIYEIIREAIADLHYSNSKKNQIDAVNYFNSSLFEWDCACVAIPKKLMLYIAYNPDKYLDKIQSYNQEDNEHESDNEFSDMP